MFQKKLRITDLNDDCLIEIFSKKSLSLMDVCSLGETCKRFQPISQRVFSKNCSINMTNEGRYDVVSRKLLQSENLPSQNIERILKNFGSFLSEVSISHYQSRENVEASCFVLKLVSEHCVENLVTLRIHSLIIPAFPTVKLNQIFKRLQILDLQYVTIEDDRMLFAELDSLVELRVRWVENCSAMLENIFPKLKRFTHWGTHQVDQLLLTFISRHTSLVTLEIDHSSDESNTLKFLHVIVNSCKELEELELDIGRTTASLLTLQSLQSLNVLKLWWVSCEDFKFMSALTRLRELHLISCDLPNDIQQFAVLSRLTRLHIKPYGSINVVGISRLLTHLEDFTISGIFVLDEERFSKIVAVVKGRPHALTLRCLCSFDSKSRSRDGNQNVSLLPLHNPFVRTRDKTLCLRKYKKNC